MSKRIFTREQIEEILRNEGVVNCSEKSITFSKQFKINAVTKYNQQGLGPTEIFRQAGMNIDWIGKKEPKNCLRRWNKTYRLKGEGGLSEIRGNNGKGKGGRPKTKNLTDAEKIKWLEAENAYLKAENDFLAKLRAKRAE
jgi:transposase-like protein